MQLKKKLGRRVAFLRHARGLTQEVLAERTSYSVDFIGLIERGINAPTLDRLEDIARVLDVEVRDLFDPEQTAPKSSKRNANIPKSKSKKV